MGDPKTADRAKQRPEGDLHCVTSSAGKHFCLACWEELPIKKSITDLHMTSVKNKQGRTRLAQKEQSIVAALKINPASIRETLPDSTGVF